MVTRPWVPWALGALDLGCLGPWVPWILGALGLGRWKPWALVIDGSVGLGVWSECRLVASPSLRCALPTCHPRGPLKRFGVADMILRSLPPFIGI